MRALNAKPTTRLELGDAALVLLDDHRPGAVVVILAGLVLLRPQPHQALLQPVAFGEFAQTAAALQVVESDLLLELNGMASVLPH